MVKRPTLRCLGFLALSLVVPALSPGSSSLAAESSAFLPNHRISDASKRSFWAHTFSSGAHNVAVHRGEVYAAWYDVRNGDSDVFFIKSADGGATFGPNIRVNDDAGKSRQYKPSLALDAAGVIYILWRDDRRGHADIFFARSGDGGKTFTKNVRLNDDTGWAYQGNPSIGVSPEGDVYAAWSDNRNGQDDIYFTVSRNKGRTFRKNIRLNDDAGRSVQSHPAVGGGPGGSVIVAWEDFRSGSSEIYLSRSTDGGATFEPNYSLSSILPHPASSLSSAIQYPVPTIQVSPSIAVGPQGHVALAWAQFKPQSVQLGPPDAARGETRWWEKTRQGDADITLAESTDGGVRFGPPLRVNDHPSGNAQAYPSVAIDGRGMVYLAWEDFRNGPADIYFTRIPHPASSPASSLSSIIYHPVPNKRVNDDAPGDRQYHPSLTVDGEGKSYLLWTDGRGNPFVSPAETGAGVEEEGNDVYFTRGE